MTPACHRAFSKEAQAAASDKSNRLCLEENWISGYRLRPSGAIHFTSLMSCVLSLLPLFPLSPDLSLLPQMEVSGTGVRFVSPDHFHKVRRG